MSAILPIVLLLFFLLNGVHRVPNDERFAVFRFGRFSRVKGPGWIFILPVFERKFRINLNRHFPDRGGWTEETLAIKIEEFVARK